jgi:hypothetical protein
VDSSGVEIFFVLSLLHGVRTVVVVFQARTELLPRSSFSDFDLQTVRGTVVDSLAYTRVL